MAVDVDRLVAEIDADPAAAIAALQMLEGALDAAARDRKAEIKVDVDRNPLDTLSSSMAGLSSQIGGLSNQMGSLTSTLSNAGGAAGGAGRGFVGLSGAVGGLGGSMGMLIPMLVMLPVVFGLIISVASVLPGLFAAIATAAGVLVGALVPLVGLLAAIPVGIAAFAGGFGVLAGALGPVIQATSLHKQAMGAESKAMDQSADRARALMLALRQLRDAKRAAREAADNLADAQKGIAVAAKEARRALVDQREAVRDAREGQRDAVEAHRDALENLRRAQENLRKAQKASSKDAKEVTMQTDYFTGKVYETVKVTGAALDQATDVRDAKEAVRDAREAVRDAQEGISDANRAARREQQLLNEMEKKGIKGSDQMVAARERLKDAQWAYKKALEGVKDAEYGVAQARKKQAEATDTATAAQDAYNKAMKELTPAGRDFVRFITGTLLPLWDRVKDVTQEGLLPGLQRGLSAFLSEADDAIVAGVGKMAKTMGDASESFFKMWARPKNVAALTDMWDGINDVLRNTLRVANPLSRVLVAITRAATPMVNSIMRGLYDWLDRIADWAETRKGAKALTKFFNDAAHFGGLWLDVLGGVGGVLMGIARAAKPLAERWLKSMDDKLSGISENLKDKDGIAGLRAYFEKSVPALKETWGLIKDISDVLFNSTQGGEDSAYVKFIKALRDSKDEWREFFETMDKTSFAEKLARGLEKFVKWVNKVDWEKVSDDLDRWAERADKIERLFDRISDIDLTGGMTGLIGTIPGIGKVTSALSGKGVLGAAFNFNRFILNKLTPNFKEAWDRNKKRLDDFEWSWKGFTDYLSKQFKGINWSEGFNKFKDRFWNNIDRSKRMWGRFLDWVKGETDKKLLGVNDAFRETANVIAEALKDAKGTAPRGRRGVQQNWSGGSLFKEQPSIVGEKGPELFIPSSSGRIMPANPTKEFLNSTSPGLDPRQVDRIVEAILSKRDGVKIDQTFNEKVDPQHVARELAWRLG